jgi:DNA-3-methyladenine glycosylase II
MAKSPAELLAERDPVLANIIQSVPLPFFGSTGNLFHDLMSCIFEQQIHYRSTKRIFQKMLDRAGLTRLSPANFEAFEKHGFADLKIAASKFETALAVLDFWQKTPLDWQKLDEAEVVRQLSSIKGIGRWTIDMLLLFTLERPNVFPSDDFHLKEIMVRLYRLDPRSRLKAQMLEVAAAWGEHRSLAVRYLLESKKARVF